MAISILPVLLLNSCGGGLTTSKNEFLGEIPSLQKYYSAKIHDKNKELKECTDMEKAFKLGKEADVLKQEWDAKIEESLKANPVAASLPFEPMKNQPYTVNKITFVRVNNMGFGFDLSIKIDQDMKINNQDYWVYYVAIDKDGKEIQDSKSRSLVNQALQNELKAGTVIEAHGSWNTKTLCNMENFAKIRFITKDEFEKK